MYNTYFTFHFYNISFFNNSPVLILHIPQTWFHQISLVLDIRFDIDRTLSSNNVIRVFSRVSTLGLATELI
jgi:hypothetical protein